MLALMKKEEELLYTRKKNNGRHLSVQGTEKHMTLNIKTYDPMVLCALFPATILDDVDIADSRKYLHHIVMPKAALRLEIV